MSAGGGAPSPGEALEDRVWPLMEGGQLKGLEAADGQTGQRHGKLVCGQGFTRFIALIFLK